MLYNLKHSCIHAKLISKWKDITKIINKTIATKTSIEKWRLISNLFNLFSFFVQAYIVGKGNIIANYKASHSLSHVSDVKSSKRRNKKNYILGYFTTVWSVPLSLSPPNKDSWCITTLLILDPQVRQLVLVKRGHFSLIPS